MKAEHLERLVDVLQHVQIYQPGNFSLEETYGHTMKAK